MTQQLESDAARQEQIRAHDHLVPPEPLDVATDNTLLRSLAEAISPAAPEKPSQPTTMTFLCATLQENTVVRDCMGQTERTLSAAIRAEPISIH